MLESTFLGLWIFGWDRLSKRVHLATVWLFALGTWLSAFFIIVANSWMQRPVGSTVTDGRAELTDVWELFSNRFGIWAYIHVLLVGLTTATVVVFGVACWHLVRGRNQELFRHAAKLALIVGVPISAVNLGVGSQMGVVVTDYQPMKIASTEAQWDTCQPCAFSLFQIGGFTVDDQTPSFSNPDPTPPVDPRDPFLDGEVQGMNPLQAADQSEYGAGDYIPPVGRPTGACGSWPTPARSSSSSRARRFPLLAREARVDALVPVARRLHDPAPVRGGARRLGAARRSGDSRGSCGAC